MRLGVRYGDFERQLSGDGTVSFGVGNGPSSQGNDRRLNAPHRPFMLRWPVYVVQRPLGTARWVALTGHIRSFEKFPDSSRLPLLSIVCIANCKRNWPGFRRAARLFVQRGV